ncbi:MAG: hypothetical protein ACK5MR_18840 [Cumulibacter sp.]
MNKYGHMAMKHWRQWRPNAFGTIQNPEDFFSTLGQEAEDQIDQIQAQILAANPPSSDQLTRAAQWQSARFSAESQVVREMLLVDPEPGMDESQNDDPDWEPMETAADWAIEANREQEEYEQTQEYLDELRETDPAMYESEMAWRAETARQQAERRAKNPHLFG